MHSWNTNELLFALLYQTMLIYLIKRFLKSFSVIWKLNSPQVGVAVQSAYTPIPEDTVILWQPHSTRRSPPASWSLLLQSEYTQLGRKQKWVVSFYFYVRFNILPPCGSTKSFHFTKQPINNKRGPRYWKFAPFEIHLAGKEQQCQRSFAGIWSVLGDCNKFINLHRVPNRKYVKL